MPYNKTQLDRIARSQCIQCAEPSGGKKRCAKCQQHSSGNLRRWQNENRDKTRESARKWRSANVEQARACDRKRYAADPTGRGAGTKRWRKAHPEALREYSRRYRTKLRALRPPRKIMTRDEARKSLRAAQVRWQKRNPEKVRRYQRRTLAKLQADEARKASRYAYVRAYCKARPEQMRTCRKKWERANPEKVKEISQRKRIRYRERINTYAKAYYKRNIERIKARSSAHAKRNKDARNARRRALYHSDLIVARAKCLATRRKRKPVSGKHTVKQWLARVEYYGWCCCWCGVKLTPKTLTMDHVIAVSKGGTDWPSNLVPACWPCNVDKKDKHYKEWKRSS